MASCDICVSGLPSNTDDAEVCELFQMFGAISSTKITHQGSQCRSIISFQLPEAAVAAAAAMRGFNHKGIPLQVRMASYMQAPTSNGSQSSQQRKPGRTFISDQRIAGSILSWKGGYGWITADTRINHPSAARHEGAVFLSKQDMPDGYSEFKGGERVSFIAYVDKDGIGAADLRMADKDALQGIGEVVNNSSETLVFVNGWPASLEDCFQKTFEHFGKVVASKIERPKHDSRASGSIQFVVPAAAKAAISAMNGKLYGGKPLRVWVEFDGKDDTSRVEALPVASPTTSSIFVPSQIPGSTDVRSFIGDDRWTGTVRAWKGNFGWLSSDKTIVDPPNAKHKGMVFVSKSDTVGGLSLQVGDRVSFKLYVDTMGNGASDVQRLQSMKNRRGLRDAPVQQTLEDEVDTNSCTQECRTVARQVTCWWHQLAGDCCPLSLTPLEELEYEPFGLAGSCDGDEIAQYPGLWGVKAREALTKLSAIHWFDGRFLACSLVSKGLLLDPMNRRQLTRAECVSLDAYLASNGLPVLNVASVWDLTNRAEGNFPVDGTAVALKALDEPVVSSGSYTNHVLDSTVSNDGNATVPRKGRRWGRER